MTYPLKKLLAHWINGRGNMSHHTMAEVFNRFGDKYLKNHRVSSNQLGLITDIQQCRTIELGGHAKSCNNCGIIKVYHNSCGNRHCPGCQGVKKEKWILEREYDLLPVKYYHVVFTLPSELRSLFFQNKKSLFNLIFKCAWDTLDAFSKDPKWKLQAKMGMISVLHTWTQKLIFHPHIHCIVPAGGINRKGRWRKSKSNGNFLFHGTPLSEKFKGLFLHNLYLLYKNGELSLKGKISYLKNKSSFWDFKNDIYNKKWVVKPKLAFNGPKQVLEYLSRYIHKIAISNYRIKKIENDTITFSYLDRNDNNTQKLCCLPAEKFIARFLLHVLPKGFVKIRNYGFLSSRTKAKVLPKLKHYFNIKQQGARPKYNVRDVLLITKGIDPDICTVCKMGTMVIIHEMPRKRGSPIISIAC